MPSKKQQRRLTEKQAIFVEEIKKNPKIPLQTAARNAGYAIPRVSATNNMKKRAVIDALSAYLLSLKREGATDARSARVISEAMSAEKEIVSDEGEIVATRPDHVTRLKANDQYLRIKKLIGSNEEDQNIGQKNQLIIVIGDKGLDEII